MIPTVSTPASTTPDHSRRPLHIAVVNQTTGASALSHLDVENVVASLRAQAAEFCHAWGLAVPTISLLPASVAQTHTDAATVDLVVWLLNDSDQAGALGYHSETDKGLFFARVFVATLAAAGMGWSSCASHEVLEALADLAVDRWVQAADSRMWALEVCDPVESDTYVDSHGVELSSYVTPAFFDQAGHAPYDKLGKLTGPFELSKGGYAIVAAGGKPHQVFGDRAHYEQVEGWRAELKATPLSRTTRRLASTAPDPRHLMGS